MAQHPLLRSRLVPLFVPHADERERRDAICSAQPRDYNVDWRGVIGNREGWFGPRCFPFAAPRPRSNPLSLLLGRLLDDFMPHKNDIKFVKTAHCNDRTAWPYGVGTKGVSQGRKENARASRERKGRTADTSSKRNRNRESNPRYCSWRQSIWFLRTRINSGRFDECDNTCVKKVYVSFIRI